MTEPSKAVASIPEGVRSLGQRPRLGALYKGDYSLVDAERELRAAVNEAPSIAVYRAQLGSVLGLLGKWNEALDSFQKAIQLAPENLDFRRETAAVLWQMGLMPAAESNLHYVLEKRPNDSGAFLLLGLVKE